MRLIVLIVFILLLSCSERHLQTDHAQQTSANAYLMKAASGSVLLPVDIEATLASAPPDAKRNVLGNGEKFMKFVTNQYISKQLVDYAINHQLDQDPQIMAQLHDYKSRLLSKAAIEHIIASEEKPDFTDLAHERYLVNQSNYQTPELIRLSHILIRVNGKQSDSDAQKIALQVYEKAKSGEDFAALAKEFSDDSSSSKGGDLGWVKKGQMVKPFDEAAFKLRESGDISNVVKTRYGYHVIKLLDKKPQKQLTFEDVKSQIQKNLEVEHNKELQSQLYMQYDVTDQTEINKDAISALFVRLKKSLKKN